MTIQVTALNRGGYSAYGGGQYDGRPAHEGGRVINLDIFEDEVINVVITFDEAPSETDYEEDGIDISTPQISGNTVTFQIQGLNASGTVALLAMFSDGSTRRCVFRANASQPFTGTAAIDPTDDDDVDYGAFG